jgi:tRNA U34 5-methylaminomethyl-2-thiouridine-forming methyltransferase MnmC
MPGLADTVQVMLAKKQLFSDLLNFVTTNERRKIAGDLKPTTDEKFIAQKEALLQRADALQTDTFIPPVDPMSSTMERLKRKAGK